MNQNKQNRTKKKTYKSLKNSEVLYSDVFQSYF